MQGTQNAHASGCNHITYKGIECNIHSPLILPLQSLERD